MNDLLPFVVAGLTTGSLYAIAAMGLVLTYKTSGIFNFGHGAVAAAAAYLFYELHTRNGLPWPLAALLCIGVFAPLFGVVMEHLARHLADTSPATRIVATVGLLLALQGTVTAIFGVTAISFPEFLPTRVYRVAGVNIGMDQIIGCLLAAGAAVGLAAFFRFSRTGLAMQAVVDDPDLLDLGGANPTRVRRQAWMIGNAFAAASGILLAPKLGLEAFVLTLLVVQAFGAAAVGRFTSIPLTYAGGLVVGVAASLSTRWAASEPSLAGLPASVPFLVLFGVLLFTPKGRFVERRARRPVRTATGPMPGWLVTMSRIILLGLLVAVPHLVGARLPVYTNAVIFVVVFLSLHLLVRTSGQVSLAHAAFAAIGATAFSHFTSAGLPWAVALLLAGLATVPVGAVLAIPAIRLSGLFLALATFGFSILVERILFGTGLMFGNDGSSAAARPDLGFIRADSDTSFYYVCLAVAVVAALAIAVLNRSRLGRLLRAMADSPVALVTHGAAVNVTRVLVFCISAFLAGVAGALFGSLNGVVSGSGFGAIQSLLWLAVLAVAGRGELAPAFGAAVLLSVVPSYLDNPTYLEWQTAIFGLSALVAALAQGTAFSKLSDRIGWAAQQHGERRRRPVAPPAGSRSRRRPVGTPAWEGSR